MFKDKTIVNVICTVIILAVMVYLLNDVFVANYNAYETETTYEVTEQDTLKLDAFIVRDEDYIDGDAKGTVVPLVPDGKRVASGDSVARICSSAEDAAAYAKLIEAREARERYESISKQTELNALDMQKLNDEIDVRYTELLKVINSRNYSELNDRASEFEDKMASKQILAEGSIDLSEKFAELDKVISSLESEKINTTDVPAPVSGYYISTIDGLEKTVNYDDVDNITVSAVRSALKAEPTKVSGKMGKIVSSYNWYIVSVVDAKYVKLIEKGKAMKVNFPNYGFEGVRVVVEHISSVQDGKVAIVLSGNMMDETYANMRIENIELVLNEYTGYKIKCSSIREAVDNKGNKINVVYILRGNVMNARKIEILYDNGEEAIVSETTEASGGYKPISLYDEVILKGRNLSNGRIVN